MTARWVFATLLAIGSMVPTGCGLLPPAAPELPIETSFAFTNLSRTTYAQLELRPHALDGSGTYYQTPRLAPGATIRKRFLDTLGAACPVRLDLRVLLFERINADVPIGLDFGETVVPTPTVAGEIADIPACDGPVVETYTIVNWDAPVGTAKVKLAQATPVENLIRSLGLFPNTDAVWEVDGVMPAMRNVPPQALAEVDPIEGRIITADGVGVGGVGVLLRSRFRVRLTDDNATNDPDAGFGDPIDFVVTSANGTFRFSRPPGAYQIEAFSDDLAFRPGSVDVESPVDTLLLVAEPSSP